MICMDAELASTSVITFLSIVLACLYRLMQRSGSKKLRAERTFSLKSRFIWDILCSGGKIVYLISIAREPLVTLALSIMTL